MLGLVHNTWSVYVCSCALPFIVYCTQSASTVHCNAPALKCTIMHHNSQMLMLCVLQCDAFWKKAEDLFFSCVDSPFKMGLRDLPQTHALQRTILWCEWLLYRSANLHRFNPHSPAVYYALEATTQTYIQSPTYVLVLLTFNTKRIQSFQENDKTALFSSILYIKQHCTSDVFVANTV